MIRLLGIITGSALALAALLVFVGVPQFRTEAVGERPAVVTLPVPTAAVDDAPAVPEVPEPAAAEPQEQTADPAGREAGELRAAAETQLETLPSSGDAVLAPAAIPAEAPQWYAFWSPFRSELAATGFVEELQRVTGLDYRVVRIKPGVYEVAFAYADDSDIGSKLSTISAATGLDLPPSE